MTCTPTKHDSIVDVLEDWLQAFASVEGRGRREGMQAMEHSFRPNFTMCRATQNKTVAGEYEPAERGSPALTNRAKSEMTFAVPHGTRKGQREEGE